MSAVRFRFVNADRRTRVPFGGRVTSVKSHGPIVRSLFRHKGRLDASDDVCCLIILEQQRHDGHGIQQPPF